MLHKSKKQEIVADLTDKFKRQNIAIFGDFQGTSVAKISLLRRILRKENAEYKVARKTLIDRSLDAVKAPIATRDMKGEISITFGYGDQAAPARALAKFGKETETFKILGALLDGKRLSAKEVLALAKLPGREALLAQVAGAMSAPLRGLAGALQANIRNLAFVLGRVRDKRPAH